MRASANLPIFELELELKEGKRAGLLALARELAAVAPLRLSFIAKSERGRRLVAGTWGKPQKASTPTLSPEMTAHEAFFAIARTCLHDFMVNEAAIGNRDDIEGVHQARIAIRRLRAAFNLFAPLIENSRIEKLSDELEWLSDLFGAARDCDVLMSEFSIDPKSQAGKAIAERRAATHKALAEGLASGRMRLLLIDLAGALDAGGWRNRGAFPRWTGTRCCRKIIGAAFRRRLLKRARDLERLGAHKRHRVRIAAKKLRYMGEFFKTLLTDEEARAGLSEVIGQLEKVQKRLGRLQDEVAFRRLLAELLGKAKAEQLAATSSVDRKAELRKAVQGHGEAGEDEAFLA